MGMNKLEPRPIKTKNAAARPVQWVASENAWSIAGAIFSPPGWLTTAGIAVPAERSMVVEIDAALAGGTPCASRFAEVWLKTTVARITLRIATPSAEPIWREVDWMPEASPEALAGTSERMTPVSCEVEKPIPSAIQRFGSSSSSCSSSD